MSTTRKKTAAAAAETTKGFTEAASTVNAAMNDGIERMTQGMNNFGTFGQENVEAFIESATTVAKGFEKLAQENAEYAKKQMEAGTEKMQSFASVKTPQEFFEAQSDFVRTAFETQIGQINKVSDMFVATARDAAQPLSKRYSAFVEMMQQR